MQTIPQRLHDHSAVRPCAALFAPVDDPVLMGPLAGRVAVAVARNAFQAASVALGTTVDNIVFPESPFP